MASRTGARGFHPAGSEDPPDPAGRGTSKRLYWAIGIAWVLMSVMILALPPVIGFYRDVFGLPGGRGAPSVEPGMVDIAGTYLLTDQSLVEGGMTAPGVVQCRLLLRGDGSFTVEDYPYWRASGGGGGPFGSLLSGSGSWYIDTVGVVYDSDGEPGEVWGVRFHGMDTAPDPMALTGKSEPFGLVVVLGDPDSGKELVFSRVE